MRVVTLFLVVAGLWSCQKPPPPDPPALLPDAVGWADLEALATFPTQPPTPGLKAAVEAAARAADVIADQGDAWVLSPDGPVGVEDVAEALAALVDWHARGGVVPPGACGVSPGVKELRLAQAAIATAVMAPDDGQLAAALRLVDQRLAQASGLVDALAALKALQAALARAQSAGDAGAAALAGATVPDDLVLRAFARDAVCMRRLVRGALRGEGAADLGGRLAEPLPIAALEAQVRAWEAVQLRLAATLRCAACSPKDAAARFIAAWRAETASASGSPLIDALMGGVDQAWTHLERARSEVTDGLSALPAPAPPTAADPAPSTLDEAALADAFDGAGVPAGMVVPLDAPDRRGARLVGVPPDSPYHALLGLRSGDLIRAVDGRALRPGTADALHRRLRAWLQRVDAPEHTLTFQRGATEQTRSYRVAFSEATREAVEEAAAPVPTETRAAWGVAPLDAHTVRLDRASLAPDRLAAMPHHPRVIPAYRNGVYEGFKLFAVRPGSLLNAIGIRNGDVVTAIDGAPVKPGALPATVGGLQDADAVTLDLLRRGQPLKLTIQLYDGPRDE